MSYHTLVPRISIPSYPGSHTLVPRISYPHTPDLILSYPGSHTIVPRISYFRAYPAFNTNCTALIFFLKNFFFFFFQLILTNTPYTPALIPLVPLVPWILIILTPVLTTLYPGLLRTVRSMHAKW